MKRIQKLELQHATPGR